MFKNGPYSGKLLTKPVGDSLGLNSLGGGPNIGSPNFKPPYTSNGLILEPLLSTDLHLVADDLSAGSDWISRSGGYVANLTGQPSIGLETPFYPNGGFNGNGYRTSVSGFSNSDYYQIPYNINNIIQNGEDVTYEVVLKTGDFTNSELLVSQTVPVGSGYNFYIATIFFGTPFIEVRIGHDVADALVQIEASRFCFYYLKISYYGATKILDVQVNGRGGFFGGMGIGNVLTGGTDPMVIGSSITGFPAVSSQLIEVQRHRGIIPDTPDGFDRATRFFGVHDVNGIKPTICIRETKAAIKVNNKLWQVGIDWPCINEKGRLAEAFGTNLLANNIFSESITTGWSSLGSSGLSYVQDPDDHKSSGGTGLKFQNDLIGTLNGLSQSVGYVGSGTPCYFYCEWKAHTAGAQAYFFIYNSSTSRYYNVLTQTWEAPIVFNKPGDSSLSKVKYQLLFNNDLAFGQIYVGICNSYSDFNTDSFSYFNVQLSEGFPSPCAPYIYETISGGNAKYRDCVVYKESESIDYTMGAFSAEITPLHSSSDPVVYDKTYLGGNTPFFVNPNGSTLFRLSDGANNADLPLVYSREQILNLNGYWNSGTMILSESTSGSIVSSLFASPISSGDLGVGGTNDPSFFITWLQPAAYIRNLQIWRKP